MSNSKPPELHDVAAENALIGAALLDYNVFLAFGVTPGDFWQIENRAIWQAGMDLARQGVQADELTLPENVVSKTGAAGLLQRVNACPSAVRAGDYAGIVREKARQRRTSAIASLMGKAAYADPETRAQLMREALESGRDLLDQDAAGVTDWTIYTLANAFEERLPLEYAIADLFEFPSLNICYGAPGALKSMLLLDAALCIAAGIPWLEPLPGSDEATARATAGVPVLWLDFDNGSRRTHERVGALARSRNLDPEAVPFFYVAMPSPWLNAASTESVDALILRAKALSAGALFVDNLGAVSGGADENSAQMIAIMSNFRRASEELGAAVTLNHHESKGGPKARRRPGEGLRGFSGIEGALDLALHVERDAGSDLVTVCSTKERGVAVPPFGAVFAFDWREGTRELDGARFYGMAVEDRQSGSAVKTAILQEVETRPGIRLLALRAAVKERCPEVGVNSIRAMIEVLVASNKLSVTKVGTAKEYYIVTSYA